MTDAAPQKTLAQLQAELEGIGKLPVVHGPPALPDPKQLLEQVQGLLLEHFRKIGGAPACPMDRRPLELAGLPCAQPVVIPVEGALRQLPFPGVPVVPLRCSRCGYVVYLSMEVVHLSATSALVKL